MDRTKQEIQGDIAKVGGAENRLQNELRKLSDQEQITLDLAAESELTGEGENVLSVLTEIRARKEAVAVALDRAKAKIEAARIERDQLERTGQAAIWGEIQPDLSKTLREIGKLIGPDGVSGLLVKAESLLNAGSSSAQLASQDAAIKVHRCRVFVNAAQNHLAEMRRMVIEIEGLPG